MKKIILLISLFFVIIACDIKKHKINKESLAKIDSALFIIQKKTKYTINADSIMTIYNRIAKDSAEAGMIYAEKFLKYAIKKREKMYAEYDSIDKIYERKNIERKLRKQKEWENTKAGKIQLKHPYWSKNDCKKIANNEIWIGMDIDMLIYMRGKPNHINTSDYGSGKEFQWCWSNLEPSCFYGDNEGIVKAYN